MTDQTPQPSGQPPWAPGGGSSRPPNKSRSYTIVGVLGVVALVIGFAVGYFALGGSTSTSASATTTTSSENHKTTTTEKKKDTTTTTEAKTTTSRTRSIDPLAIPDGYNAYRAGGGAAFALALPETWTAVLLDSGALDHEAEVHKANANLVSLLDGVKSLQGQGGIFFAYDGASPPNFENNINVIENTKVQSLPSDVEDEIRTQLSSLSTPAENIQFSQQTVAGTTALIATYEVKLSANATAYGVQAYFTGGEGLYIVTMTFDSADTRQKIAPQVWPTVNVP